MDELNVKVVRYEKERGRWLEEYVIPKVEGMTVLGALMHIHENVDETLAIDYNCRAGRCGTCGIILNGKPALACETGIGGDVAEITVAPKNNQEVVRDLISVDPDVWDIRKRILHEMPFTVKKNESYVIYPHQTERFQKLDNCIECSLCQSACPNLKQKGWVGPMHGVFVAKLDSHPLDILDRSEYLNNAGLVGCNTNTACQVTCPKEVPITMDALIPEKETWVSNHDPLLRIINGIKKRIGRLLGKKE